MICSRINKLLVLTSRRNVPCGSLKGEFEIEDEKRDLSAVISRRNFLIAALFDSEVGGLKFDIIEH